MGRPPWTDRLTVEDCYVLAVEQLAQKGYLSAPNGTNCSISWTNGDGIELFGVGLRLVAPALGKLVLIFCYDAASSYAPSGNRIEYRVEITATSCRFGGQRYWFLCPVVQQGIRCSQRVRKLYLPSGGGMFGCRKCHNLTYMSCRTHNKTLDRLAKDPKLIGQNLQSADLRRQMLGVAAYTEALRRVSKDKIPIAPPTNSGSKCRSVELIPPDATRA